MPLDPIAKGLLDQLTAAGLPPFESMSPVEARAWIRQMMPPPAEPEAVASVEPLKCGDVPGRIYRPESNVPLPILLYIHGGGWVIGDLDTHDSACRAIANAVPAVVVSLDYRLAPEHKFPSAVDDCYAALCWVAENALKIGGDPVRLAVGGDSAGGNLGAAVALLARDRGKPKVGFQLLVYPATDARMQSRSITENGEGYFLTAGMMKWFWGHYLYGPTDVLDPRVSPALAPSHEGLPPAYVITAEYDPLRDEGEEYARMLIAAGVPTTLRRYDGLIHGFFTMTEVFPQAREAIRDAAAAMREALGVAYGGR
jgi:acetyl esterase